MRMPVRAVDRRRARVVATAAVQRASAAGVELPAGLRIWALAGWEPGTDLPSDAAGDLDGAGDLAVVLERATSARRRKAKGLHVTPAWLADHLVERCLAATSIEPAPEGGAIRPHSGAGSEGAVSVCDPACGGGAFLLAAARGLAARGHSRQEIVRDLLWGADVDPVGVAAAEVALALWAGEAPPLGRLVVGDALARGAGLWRASPVPAGGFGAVVGNPPFLSQLGRATARPAAETERLRARFGDAVRMYTDAAWLFLLLGCELVRPGGAVTLVQPLSVVAARDAAAVRAALGDRAHLHELWVEDRGRPAFAAAVHVCAPVLTTPTTAPAAAAADGGTSRGAAAVAGEMASDRAWADRLAEAVGVPAVEIDESGCVRLGAVADVAAGFRDEYYGIVPLVHEADDPDGEGAARLVTTGALDWGRTSWGERPARFAKRIWDAPVVDVAAAAALDPTERSTRAVRRWLERTSGPKLLVASQTRVVELAVDGGGCWVPSVPTLAVVPRRADDLWLLAAATASPTATAWLWRRAPGTALSRDALKVAARDLADLPLPADRGAWEQAAGAFRAYVEAPDPAAFDAYVEAAAKAYDASPELVAWWRARAEPVSTRLAVDGSS